MDTKNIILPFPENEVDARLLGRMLTALGSALSDGPGGATTTTATAEEIEEAVETAEGDGTPVAAAGPFEGEQMEANLRWLLSEVTWNARMFLRTIAEQTIQHGGANATTLRQILGAKSAPVMAGWAASIGFAMKRLKFPRVYAQSWEHTPNGWENVYRMPLPVAEATLRLVPESGHMI